MASGPLAGRRIVVTRPEEQARRLAGQLERLGADVWVVPLVAIRPVEESRELETALSDLRGYDWVVFTSANGVAAVGDRVPRIPAGMHVAVVGPATADAVRALGVEPVLVARGSAEDVLRSLGQMDGARILLPQADVADPGLAEGLRERGATVDALVAYRTVEIEPNRAGRRRIREADAVVLASGSGARSLASLGSSGAPGLVVCIGPKTASTAREVGLDVGLVADEATADGIIRALVSYFGEST